MELGLTSIQLVCIPPHPQVGYESSFIRLPVERLSYSYDPWLWNITRCYAKYNVLEEI